MDEFLPFIIIGLATGAVYGLAGLGLVLTYKTSGIFNFGFGAVAALSAFCFYYLHVEQGMSWPIAAVITVAALGSVLGIAMELLARALARASETFKVVATVGLILIILAIGRFWHEINPPTFPHFLPTSVVRMFGVNITWEQIILFVFCVVVSALLYWFFQSVRLGIVMRAIVDSPDLVSMSGDDPATVRRWAWVIGTVFAAIAGLFLAPGQQVDGISLTVLVFAAFGAAAIGYFDNLPLTFAGGLIIGVATALFDKYAGTIDWVGGLPPSLPFIILFVVLIITPRRRLVRRRVPTQENVQRSYQAPLRIRLVTGAVVVGLLAIVPVFQEPRLAVWSRALIDIMLFLSLGILVRNCGQISLCHLAFAAVGAAAFGHFTTDAGLPWLLAIVLATLVAIPVGAVIAVPAVRVSGVFLALATLGFGILAQYVFYSRGFMFGPTALGVGAPRPEFTVFGMDLASDKGFYYLLLFITVIVTVGLTAIMSGRLGRLLQAMGDSQLALETRGTNSTILKVIVFCLTAAVASLAGSLIGMLNHFAVGTSFQPFDSMTLVVLVAIVAFGAPWFAVMAAVGHGVISGYVEGGNIATWLLLLFGVTGLAAVYGTRFGRMPGPLRDFLDRVGGRTRKQGLEPSTKEATTAAAASHDREATLAREGLEVRNLSVTFGGVAAVDNLSLLAPIAQITGLIGPNGAGKTTTFNVCSGLLRSKRGSVCFDGDRRHSAEYVAPCPARTWSHVPAAGALQQSHRPTERGDGSRGVDGRISPADAARGVAPQQSSNCRCDRRGAVHHGHVRHCRCSGRAAPDRAAPTRGVGDRPGRTLRSAPAR